MFCGYILISGRNPTSDIFHFNLHAAYSPSYLLYLFEISYPDIHIFAKKQVHLFIKILVC